MVVSYQPIKNSSSGSPNKPANTSFAHVSAPQGLQEAHGLHLLVPGAGVVGGTYQPIKNSSSGSPNKSADTSFAPVSAPQGLQEAHGLHLLVPGVGVGVQTYMSPINDYCPSCDESVEPSSFKIGSVVSSNTPENRKNGFCFIYVVTALKRAHGVWSTEFDFAGQIIKKN